MIVSLHHASFTVENLERSVAFYRETLGLRLEGVWERNPEYAEILLSWCRPQLLPDRPEAPTGSTPQRRMSTPCLDNIT